MPEKGTGDWVELLLMTKQNVMVAWSRLEAEETEKGTWIWVCW